MNTAWISLTCACGARLQASPLLAGGPIPCDACGGVAKAGQSVEAGRGPLQARRRSLARREVADPTPILALGALASLVAAFFVSPTALNGTFDPAAHCLSAALVTGIDLLVIVGAGWILGLAVGTLHETLFKITIAAQALAIVAGGSLALGGFAPLFASLACLLLGPSLLVRLFKWTWAEAILVFMSQVLVQYAVLSAMARAAA